ncbi:MAG: hypothetical protein VW582_08730 [Rhodospirillaceae bacterium]
MDDVEALLEEIEIYCRTHAMAESTFGRMAVNDGKFVGRLRDGSGVTSKTMTRVRAFITSGNEALDDAGKTSEPASKPRRKRKTAKPAQTGEPAGQATDGGNRQQNFRFYDNRQKYLMFVNTCSEKWAISQRISAELDQIKPRLPALRVFDAGMGDGTVISHVLRDMHRRHPTVPFLVVGKEISLEDVRLSLEKVPDRLFEHPATVLVVTNLYYREAPGLMPGSVPAAAALNWHEIALEGSSAHEFDEQIQALYPVLSDGWQVQTSPETGNPQYVRPSVVVLYRKDQKFFVDPIIPRPGRTDGQYDLVIASQPYRARMDAEFKVNKVLEPLARSLAPGGRMLGVHSHGHDPGLDIIQAIWPGRELQQTNRHLLMKTLRTAMGKASRDLRFNTYSDKRSLFRYDMHTLPNEIDASIGTSTLFAAWNAAIYVYQIEDEMIASAVSAGGYLEATQKVLQEHGGLWFTNESYVVTRKAA